MVRRSRCARRAMTRAAALLVSTGLIAACGSPAPPDGFPSGDAMGVQDLQAVEEDSLVSTVGSCPVGAEPFSSLSATNGRQVRYVSEQRPVVGLFELGASQVEDVVAAARAAPEVCSTRRTRLQLDEDVAAAIASGAGLDESAVVVLTGEDGTSGPVSVYRRAAADLGDGRVVVVTTGDVADGLLQQQALAAVESAREVTGVPRR